MNIKDAFPSNYLKSADLGGRAVRVTIDTCTMEDVGDGEKPVLFFQGKQKGIVLNKTNASMVAELYGDETSGWAGKVVELYPDKTQYQGRIVDCIRLRGVAPPPSEEVEDGEVPF